MQAVVVREGADPVEKFGLMAVRDSETYMRYAQAYFGFCRENGLVANDPETLKKWADVQLEHHSPTSLVPMLAAVKKALRGAAKELATAKEAAAFSEALRLVKAPKKASKAIRREFVLTKAEEQAVLAIMTPRDALLFRFLLATGCRISETLGIKIADCKQDGRMYRVSLLGKGNKAREVRISAELYDSIREVYDGKEWLFETASGKQLYRDYAYRRISQAVLHATGKHFSPHGCRHTFATRAIGQTAKIEAVSKYLGHANAGITLSMYVHESLNDDELLGIG